MDQFDKLLPFVLTYEGVTQTNPTGLTDIPGDTGGVTKWGISQKRWSRIYYKFDNFSSDVRDLTREQIEVIYRKVFFPVICSDLPPGLALIVFDAEVNQGNGVVMLQRALNVDDDGVVGPETLGALRLASRNVPKLMDDVLWERVNYYKNISKGSVTNQGFLAKLWLPRLLTLRDDALKLGVS